MKNILGFILLLLASSNLLAQDFITTWQTDKQGSSNNDQITIPTGSGTFNYNVDWGDGTSSTGLTSSVTHTFPSSGIYTVSISGDFPHLSFSGAWQDWSKLLTIEQWGNQQWLSMNSSFRNCYNLTYNATDIPDLSLVTDMSYMFFSAGSFNGAIGNWDVSTVDNMEGMFRGAANFNQNIGSWDVSNVNDMYGMFYDAFDFNQDIGNWNVSNVTNMAYMFSASAFNQAINTWDVSSVDNIAYMFRYNFVFNQDLNDWDISNMTNLDSMFFNATAFNGNISDWDVSNVTNMHQLFYFASSFNQDLSNWNVSSAQNMAFMFSYATSFNQDISSWDVSNTNIMVRMFENSVSFDQDLGQWNVSNVSLMSNMFLNVTLSLANYDSLLNGWNALSLQPGVNFHGGNSVYCTGETSRLNMVNSDNWTITDSGLDCSGLSNNEFNNSSISLFPNPAKNSLNILGLNKTYTVQIVNIHGQIIKEINNYNSGQINISELTSGLYFIKFKTLSNNTKAFKFLKE